MRLRSAQGNILRAGQKSIVSCRLYMVRWLTCLSWYTGTAKKHKPRCLHLRPKHRPFGVLFYRLGCGCLQHMNGLPCFVTVEASVTRATNIQNLQHCIMQGERIRPQHPQIHQRTCKILTHSDIHFTTYQHTAPKLSKVRTSPHQYES
jgi:hypothetical protein